MSLSAPIITAVQITPMPVDAGASYIIAVTIEEATYARLAGYTQAQLSVYTHEQLSTQDI